MITAEAVRKYLSDWGYLPSDFLISEHQGTVVVTRAYSDAPLRAAAHHLRFCPALSVDERSPDHLWVYVG